MKLNDRGDIIEPNVGDAELTRMEFNVSGAVLHFKLHNGSHFALTLDEVWWISFSTNFTQNVVSSISITGDTNNIDAPEDIKDRLFRRRLRIPEDTSEPETLAVVKIGAAAGPEMICIAEKARPAPPPRLVHVAQPRSALLPVESLIIQRLENNRWQVTERRADSTDIEIGNFASLNDAQEWSNWKQGVPATNPYAE